MNFSSVAAEARKYLLNAGTSNPVVENVKKEGERWIAICTVSYGMRVKKLTFDDRTGEVVGYEDITPAR